MKTTTEQPVKTATRNLLTGAQATAHAMRQINPDVVPLYPITPQTPIIQTFSKFVADGKATSEIINVESEHSAMSAAIGAATSGARTITATASQGLALMIENVYIAASMRLPITMAIGNRALSAPINIHCDHSDTMLARDSGVIQIYVENAQEAYDYMIMAPRIAEHADVYLPVLVCQDGFTITHTAEPVSMLEDETVQEFIGNYHIPYPLLDLGRPTTQGPFDMPDYYFEHKRQQHHAMDQVPAVLDEIQEAFSQISGRSYSSMEAYKLDDAEYGIVVLGSAAGTIKEVVDRMRVNGKKIGLLKIRSFRPFEEEKVRHYLEPLSGVAVLDRSISFGSYGPLYTEVCRALKGSATDIQNYVFGLGGRDLFPSDIEEVIDRLDRAEKQNSVTYIGVRE